MAMTTPHGEAERAGLAPAAALFRSLGDPARLVIVRCLAGGPARVTELTAALGLAQSTVSKHLACLRDCGLVTSEPAGRASVFRLAQPALADMFTAAEQVLRHRQRRRAVPCLGPGRLRGAVVTAARPVGEPGLPGLPVVADACCAAGSSCHAEPPAPAARDAGWLRAVRQARWLAWASLAWMCTEGGIGLWQGLVAGSVALTGWALGSTVEGLASVVVIWRFTGTRILSETAERRPQRAVALSFWLLAPYIAAESVQSLVSGHHPEATTIGMALTAVALLEMPLLGRAKHRLGARLGSAATTGEGTQNYLCAAQAAAVLLALAVTAAWPAAWWLDPAIGLGIAAVAVREGAESWRGDDCC